MEEVTIWCMILEIESICCCLINHLGWFDAIDSIKYPWVGCIGLALGFIVNFIVRKITATPLSPTLSLMSLLKSADRCFVKMHREEWNCHTFHNNSV